MLLYFRMTCNRLNLSILEAFETAYMYRFNKIGHVVPDYCEYIAHGVIPPYVKEWLKSLQGASHGSHQVHPVQPHGADGGEGGSIHLDPRNKEEGHT